MLKELLSSKKAIITIIGLVLNLIVAAGVIKLDEAARAQVMQGIMAIVGTYVVGQGIADHGKEKAKVEVANGNSNPTPPAK